MKLLLILIRLFPLFKTIFGVNWPWSNVIPERPFVHYKNDIPGSWQVLISQRPCTSSETPIFIHTEAISSGKYYNHRMSIRNTWGKDAQSNGMRIFFVMGLPVDASLEQRRLQAEALKHNDILQFDFIDEFYNQTLKSIAMLKWANEHCNASAYLLKIRDDAFLNVPLLSQLVNQSRFSSGFTGAVVNTPAIRNLASRWYMPIQYYPKENYQHLRGFAYVLSTDVLGLLLETIETYTGPILDIGNLFLTGVIADYATIERHNSGLFAFYCGSNSCVMEASLAVACNDNRSSERMYRLWKQYNSDNCFSTFLGTGIL